MSLSKRHFRYSNNCLYFSKRPVPLLGLWLLATGRKIQQINLQKRFYKMPWRNDPNLKTETFFSPFGQLSFGHLFRHQQYKKYLIVTGSFTRPIWLCVFVLRFYILPTRLGTWKRTRLDAILVHKPLVQNALQNQARKCILRSVIPWLATYLWLT